MTFSGSATRVKEKRRAFVWIPQPYQKLNWALKIDGNTIPRAKIFDIKYSMSVTDEIGKCNLEINNNDNSYSFSGGESIEIYVDFKDGDTLRWKGEVEKPAKAFQSMGKTIKITGRHLSSELLDITVTESFTDTAIETILETIVGTYATSFTYDKNTYPCSTTATVKWENTPFWECIVDLCNLAGYDCYVNPNSEFVFREKSSVINQDEVIVHENALDIKGLGTDQIKLRNKIIVNGTDSDGNPIVATAIDSDSPSSKIREKIIDDDTINTEAQAQARADAELALLKDLETAGEVTSMIMPDLNPGDKVWISYPMLQIHDTYRVVKFETSIYKNPPQTKVWINSVRKIPELFRERIKSDLVGKEIKNPEKMEHSFNMTFDDESNIATLTKLEVTGGVIKVEAGANTGSMISNAVSASNDITQAYIIPKGNNITTNLYYVSNNGGTTWESISPKTLHNFTTAGNQLAVKVSIYTTTSELDALCILYK